MKNALWAKLIIFLINFIVVYILLLNKTQIYLRRKNCKYTALLRKSPKRS